MEVRCGGIDKNKAAMTHSGVLKTVRYFEAQLVRKDRTDVSGRHCQCGHGDPPLLPFFFHLESMMQAASHLQPPPEPHRCPITFL